MDNRVKDSQQQLMGSPLGPAALRVLEAARGMTEHSEAPRSGSDAPSSRLPIEYDEPGEVGIIEERLSLLGRTP